MNYNNKVIQIYIFSLNANLPWTPKELATSAEDLYEQIIEDVNIVISGTHNLRIFNQLSYTNCQFWHR